MDIIQAFEDRHLFGSLIKDQRTWSNWKVVLKCIFGLSLSDEELKIYRKYTGREKPPQNPFKEIFLIVGRRGGKSFISAIIAVFLAIFKDWREYLRPGEIGYIMTIATDRRQAGVILGYVRAILRLPMFKKFVVNDKAEEIELSNQITIAVHTCSFRALRGYTTVAALCDELSFWRHEGMNPSSEILTAIRPSLATIPDSMILALSTPYSRTGPLFESYRDKYGKDDGEIFVFKAPSKVMNSTIRDKEIERAFREDPVAARSEWEAEFREDLENFLSLELIDSAIVRGRYELAKRLGFDYFSFCDPSGGRHDSMTLSVCHREDNKIVQDAIRVAHAPFNPSTVVKNFATCLRDYGLDCVTGDRYSGEWVVKAFEQEGILFENEPISKSDLYLEFLPLIARGEILLLDHKELIAELRGLERKTGRQKDIVDHGPGMKDDIVNSTVGAAVLCSREEDLGTSEWIELGEEPEMKDWEKQMIQKVNPPIQEQKDEQIERLTTRAFVRKFSAFSQKFDSLDDIAREMKIDPELLKRWVQEKGSFINEVMLEARENEREFETV